MVLRYEAEHAKQGRVVQPGEEIRCVSFLLIKKTRGKQTRKVRRQMLHEKKQMEEKKNCKEEVMIQPLD